MSVVTVTTEAVPPVPTAANTSLIAPTTVLFVVLRVSTSPISVSTASISP